MRLSENSITDYGGGVTVIKNVVKLGLACNNIDDGGAIALAESFKTSRRLMELHVTRNNITDKGACCEHSLHRKDVLIRQRGVEIGMTGQCS